MPTLKGRAPTPHALRNRLKGKRILAVDDEPDVLDTLEELLSMCDVIKATGFDQASELLNSEYFDIAILDIMGVDGYRLLELANKRKVTAVMLTAHALSPDNIVKSYKEGAASYVPKDEITHITTFLEDILEARDKGKSLWWRWLDRLGSSYFDRKFGPGWQDQDKEFWRKFNYL